MPSRAALVAPLALLLPLAAQTGMPRLFDLPLLVPGSAPPGYSEDMDLLGDLDNDGDVDVIAFTRVVNSYVRISFRPLYNDGFGNLTAGTPVALPTNVGALMAAADVDGDGFLDVITNVASATLGTGLLIYRGLGGTSWAAPLHVPLPGHSYYLRTGHANGDGVVDLFVLYSVGGASFEVRWVLGDPALTFPTGPGVSFGASSIANGAMVDLDGDGLTDFAGLLGTAPGQAAVLYRTTPAGLVPYGTLPISTSGTVQMIAADMDGDGDTDLQTEWQQSSSRQFKLLRNDGAAGFTALQPHGVPGPQAYSLRAVDWDGDGDLDLLARDGGLGGSGPVGYGITLLENVAGTFVSRRRDAFAENTLAMGAGTADLDGDGRQDYVEPHAVVFGTGGFVLRDASIASPGDWDGDGDLDNVLDSQLQLFQNTLHLNDGRGVLTAVASFWPAPPPNHLYGTAVATADFDGDGLREVLAPLLSTFYAAFVEMRRLEVNGDDRLVDVGLASTLQIGGLPDDVDDDGDVDLLSSQGVWSNDGTGAFSLVPFSIAGFAPARKSDLDGDGDQDFIGNLVQQVAVVYRTGPGTYSMTAWTIPGIMFFSSSSGSVADLDDDGDPDFVAPAWVAPFAPPLAVVFTNNGGTLSPGSLLGVGGTPMSGDLDGDGLTDLCLQDQNTLYVLRRSGPGMTFAPPVPYAWPHARRAGDLDQDGDIDLLGASTLWNRRFGGPSAGERRQYGIGGAGSGGRRPLLSLVGPLRTGLTTSARVVAAPGGSVGVLFVSTVEANIPNALPGVTSWIGASFPALVGVFGGPVGQPGVGSVEMPIAIPPGVNGTRLFLQFVLVDPAMPIGLGYSNGCELFVGL